jgi:crotonobetainyl-CoA:carnitine CoA-transferase CaiB-like acyl-CoA transferase
MKPLEGVTILDLSRVLACPFATMVLAELGATVIKVEQPGAGDETRGFEPFFDGGLSGYFAACNRGKKSVTVNLRHKAGVQVVRELAARADAFVENFPTGTLARRGLDWPALKAVNPRLVYLSCTGFGQTGPYAQRKGYDTVFQAMGGLLSLTGERGGGPVKPGLPVADLTSGLWIAIALLSMLHGRARTGEGAFCDFSMFDGQVALLTIAAARHGASGASAERLFPLRRRAVPPHHRIRPALGAAVPRARPAGGGEPRDECRKARAAGGGDGDADTGAGAADARGGDRAAGCRGRAQRACAVPR